MPSDIPLLFAHIGDLHITKAKEQNYIDLLSIISQIEVNCSPLIDFVYLPGDNADNGLPQQYKLVDTALKMLSIPVHVITGDHDMEPKSLDNYKQLSFAEQLPLSLEVKGYRCLFLDVCGAGTGGPDFRLGSSQLSWLQNECKNAKTAQERIIVFMHTFPDDLKDVSEKQVVNDLIKSNDIVLVDMGHTHYNELANDGHTIFAATRSTGQIEEGPVGYSIISIDNGIVSWRFKPLHDAFPFVMITSPADHRLTRSSANQADVTIIRAVVFGSETISGVQYHTGDDNWLSMQLKANKAVWEAILITPLTKNTTITVKATDNTGRPGIHQVTIKPGDQLNKNYEPGSDEASVGIWPENGIMGTQLGPNRNGKPS